jgi:hypothetical protein
VKANLIAHINRIVDRFVATGNVKKGKNVGRPPVNEETQLSVQADLQSIAKKSSKSIFVLFNSSVLSILMLPRQAKSQNF